MQLKDNFSFLKSIKNFNFLVFCKNNAPKEELLYAGFGIFCMISTICTMYYISGIPGERERKSLLYIYESMLILSMCFVTYPIWPQPLKKDSIAQVIWNIGIIYLLIICSSFFLMLSNFGSLAIVVFTVNIIVVAILTRWKIAIGMTMLGLYAGTQFYKYYTGVSVESLNVKLQSSSFILYAFLLIGIAIVIFLKPKQEKQELIEEKNEHLVHRITDQEKEVEKALILKSEFIRNITHEFHAPQTGITTMAQVLYEGYYNLTDEQRRMAVDTILKSSIRLDSYSNNIINLAKVSASSHNLTITNVNLSKLVAEHVNLCRKLYIEDRDSRIFELNINEGIKVQCDRYYIGQAIDNLIINAINYCKKGQITIELKEIMEGIEFSIADDGIGIPQDEIYDIFDPFTVSSKTKTIAGGRGVGLALCKKVIELHGGTINAESDGEKGEVFKFILAKK